MENGKEYVMDITTIAKSGLGDDFDALVAAEIAKGAPPSVAPQRVVNLFGARPNARVIAKRAASGVDFMAEVNAMMIAKRCARTVAMAEVRKRYPGFYAEFQEV